MVADTLPPRIGRQRAFYALVRASELAIEGQALCDEVSAGATRLQTLAAAGSRAQLVDEAGRLGHRAQRARGEFARLASEIDE